MAAFKVLKWQRAVINHVVEHRPSNQASIMALVPVLASHADSDGSHVYPSQETMATESGLHRDTVRDVVKYLMSSNLLEHVGNRARGLREYRLQMSDSMQSDGIQMSDSMQSDGSDVGSDVGSDAEMDATTSVTSVTSKSARGDSTFYRWAVDRAKSKSGGPGLVKTILAEDRDIFEAEKSELAKVAAIEACGRCDKAGLFDVDSNTRSKCNHRVSA